MKRQIDFDFSKWGQEGISVETRAWNKKVVKMHGNPIRDEYYGITIDGATFALPIDKLDMFEEVKPRNVWVDFKNERFFLTEQLATTYAINYQIVLTKFVEVLD